MIKCTWKNCKEKEIKVGDSYQLVALDIPYINIYFHRDCFDTLIKEVESWDNITIYLLDNLNLWFDLPEETKKTKRKKRK